MRAIFLALTITAAALAGSAVAGEDPMIKTHSELVAQVGQSVVLEGTVSRIPWQHLIASVPSKRPEYFDLPDRQQIVVYVPTDFPCRGRARLRGQVLRVEGGGKGHKSEDRFSEYHLDVASWECLETGIDASVDQLVDPSLSQAEKRVVEERITAVGKAAIPALIRHLDDRRTCWTERRLLNAGQLMNRPPLTPPVAEEWREVEVPVSTRVERLLLRIISPPAYRSPFATHQKPFSAGEAGWMFRVEDWKSWWEENREKSLERIHVDLRPVIDAYWQSHGVEQVVR